MATAYEVDQWKDICRNLTSLLDKSRREKEELTRRIRDNSEEASTARAIADGLEWEVDDLKAQNAKLRELLVDCVDVADAYYYGGGVKDDLDTIKEEMRELGIEG